MNNLVKYLLTALFWLIVGGTCFLMYITGKFTNAGMAISCSVVALAIAILYIKNAFKQ